MSVWDKLKPVRSVVMHLLPQLARIFLVHTITKMVMRRPTLPRAALATGPCRLHAPSDCALRQAEIVRAHDALCLRSASPRAR